MFGVKCIKFYFWLRNTVNKINNYMESLPETHCILDGPENSFKTSFFFFLIFERS